MKKSCVFLFVMSIILLLLAVFETVYNIWWLYEFTRFKATYLNWRFVVIFLVFFLPGLLGIIGSIKRGRFTVVCIVIGSLLALYVFGEGAVYILRGFVISLWYGVHFVCFALYTAAAAVAFKSRKTA